MIKKSNVYVDPAGQEVPAKYVSAYDKARDRIAKKILALWAAEEDRLKKLKAQTEGLIGEVRKMAAKDSSVKLGGEQGYLQFRDFSGRIIVRFENVKQSEFVERLAVAQQLVREAIDDMAGDVSKNAKLAGLRKIAEAAFKPRGRSGKLDRQRVRDIAEVQVDPPKWRKAADIIRECDRVVGHRSYVRVGYQVDPKEKAEYVVLDISAV